MKRISEKIFLIIFICSLFNVVLIGTITIFESSKILKADAQKILTLMAGEYSAKFSSEFILIEEKLNDLEQHILETLNFTELKNNPAYLAQYEKQLTPLVEEFANNRTNAISAWVYFDPKWSAEPHDIYFVDGNDDGIAERQQHIPFEYFDNIPLPEDDKEWWYGPKRTGKVFWTNPYKWTVTNNKTLLIVSCAKPFYVDGEFIGILGTYYLFDDMYNEVKDIQVFEKGFASLFNEKLDVIIHPSYSYGTRFNGTNLTTVDKGKYIDLVQATQKTNQGCVFFEEQGKEIPIAFAKLSNGWLMALTPDPAEMYASLYALVYKLMLVIAACTFVSFIVAYFMGKYLAKPILHLVESAKRIGTGDLSVIVKVNTKDEIKNLADSLNEMTRNIMSLQHTLMKQAYYDDLTGAQKLNKFKVVVPELLARNPNKIHVLIKMDIDRFKLINDLYGFAEGDKILINIAKALDSIQDSSKDTFARIVADEFIMFFSIDNIQEIDILTEKFRNTFIALHNGPFHYKLPFNVGRYFLEPEEKNITAMVEKVNIAHRLSKTLVGKVCDYHKDIKQLVLGEKEIEDHMESAFLNKEFKLYLQPKYDLCHESIVGAEALVRWVNSEGNIKPPNTFIYIFERNGFITKLDFYMFEQACMALKAWIDAGLNPVAISVNFSRLHLNNLNFVAELLAITSKYNIPPKLLEIEITETAMFDNVPALTVFLENLNKAGFILSMDDFGTGYSSLGLLKNLPIHVIKLDRSFFVDALDEFRSRAVIETIIEMTKKLHIITVAEGVEERKHIDLLKELRCDIVQGYYYAKPMYWEDVTKLL